MAIIEISNLSKNYTTKAGLYPALKNINLSIESGEFVAVMGASGSGKSTFMNILGCLDVQTSGSYLLDGSDVSSLSGNKTAEIRNKSLGFVFQGFNLLPRMSILENVALPMIYSGRNRLERKNSSLAMLERVGLLQFADRYPNMISGGQQQRAAIARALINTPKIILADEPTGNLDTKTSQEIMELFSELNREGITIVLVTHEIDIANYAQRLARFKDGELMYDGVVTHDI